MSKLYTDNTIHWRKGNVVLHYCDEKHPRMFMVVIGYTRDGLCKTQYVNKDHKRTIYKNELKNLLDPQDFGFRGNESAEQYERVRLWNYYYKIGTPVIVIDGDKEFISQTRSNAWLANGSIPLVLIAGKAGGYYLKFVEPIKAGTP